MNFVPRMAAIIGLASAGAISPVLAGGIQPGNGGAPVMSLTMPHPQYQSVLSPADAFAGPDPLAQKFGVHDGRMDFFSGRPSDSGEFKPLLRGGVGDGGLQLQLKW
jgi:hypothetical protein